MSDAAKDVSLHQDLSAICRALRTSSLFIDGKAQLSEQFLATILSGLRSHYETTYGKDSIRPRPVVIPPIATFLDFKSGGSVHVMLATLLEGATVRDLLPLDRLFDGSAPAAAILPLLHEIDKNLHASGLLSRPAVFLNRVPVGIINKLSRITLQLGGRIVNAEDKASHVVDWNEEVDTGGAEGEEAAARLVSLTSSAAPNDTARVHFAYFPDSFDEIVPAASAGPLDAADHAALAWGLAGRRRYGVSCRFLLDAELFNEWGSEMDYDLLPSEEESDTMAADMQSSRRSSGKAKRKSSAVAPKSTSSASTSVSTSAVPPFAAFPDALPPSMTNNDSAGMKLLDLTDGSLRAAPPSAITEGVRSSATQACREAGTSSAVEEEGTRKRKHHLLVLDEEVPAGVTTGITSPSSWLKMDGISSYERRYLSDLLPSPGTGTGTSAAEVFYVDARNALLQASALNPGQYLSATEARRKVAGDASKIMRIHAFLDAVGAINSKVKLEARPAALDEDFVWAAKRDRVYGLLDRKYHHSRLLGDRPSPSACFTADMDAALLRLLQERGGQGQWADIAQALGVSSSACMARFMEMTLPCSSAEEVQQPEQEEVAGSRTGIERCAKRAVCLLQQLDIALAQLSAHSGTPEGVQMDVEGMMDALKRTVGDELAAARDALTGRADAFFEDVAAARLDALDGKIKVFGRLEALLALEKEKVEIDKRDLLLRQINLGVNPLPYAAPVTVGLSSYNSSASLATYR